jgi:hypothetical protein
MTLKPDLGNASVGNATACLKRIHTDALFFFPYDLSTAFSYSHE